MKLQQLRYLVEVERRGLNVSAAAEALFTSQPGVSKQIGLLEEELGLTIFERSGKRLTGITPPGRAVLAMAQRMLAEAQNMKRVGEDYAAESSGTLSIATTHTQARYTLPPVIRQFVGHHPRIRLHIQQAELLTLPCFQWTHLVVTPRGHPLLERQPLTLAALAGYPLITYDATFTGRSHIDRAFERQSLRPDVMLTAIDSDVIKTYVGLGLGVGIIAEMAFDPLRDDALAALPAGHLFEGNTTRIAFRRDTWLRGYDYDFMELLAPQQTRGMVEATLKGEGADPGL